MDNKVESKALNDPWETLPPLQKRSLRRSSPFRLLFQRGKLFSKLLEYRFTGRKRPIVANLFVTGACNLTCEYCYAGDDPDKAYTVDDWLKIIDYLCDKGVRMFTLVGGEPLLYKHLDRIINHLYDKNVVSDLCSNGYLVPKNIEILKKISQLFISVDGCKETHDFIRGEGSWQKAIEAIACARNENIPVRVNFTITKNNLDQLDWIMGLCERYDTVVTFTPIFEPREDLKEASDKKMWMTKESAQSFFRELRQEKLRSNRITNSLESIEYFLGYPKKHLRDIILKTDPESSYYEKPCSYGSFQYHFTNTGEVVPCGVLWNRPDLFKPKSVLTDGIEDSIKHASCLECQCCSFANLVDWNSITTLPWFWNGLKFTLNQAFG